MAEISTEWAEKFDAEFLYAAEERLALLRWIANGTPFKMGRIQGTSRYLTYAGYGVAGRHPRVRLLTARWRPAEAPGCQLGSRMPRVLAYAGVEIYNPDTRLGALDAERATLVPQLATWKSLQVPYPACRVEDHAANIRDLLENYRVALSIAQRARTPSYLVWGLKRLAKLEDDLHLYCTSFRKRVPALCAPAAAAALTAKQVKFALTKSATYDR